MSVRILYEITNVWELQLLYRNHIALQRRSEVCLCHMLCQFITKIVTGYTRLSSTICQTFSSEKGFHVVNISAQINIYEHRNRNHEWKKGEWKELQEKKCKIVFSSTEQLRSHANNICLMFSVRSRDSRKWSWYVMNHMCGFFYILKTFPIKISKMSHFNWIILCAECRMLVCCRSLINLLPNC